jgi:cbb3-type cytochrome oxidase cytochrome c subunit
MLSGQSAGFGTSDGDQQYVKGILSASARHGPSVLDMGSRSNEWRHALMRSPRLRKR